MFGSQSSAKKRIAISGFGLIELLVSISIMVLVMGVVLTRQDSFNSATLLRGQAFELALSIREMQLMAVSAEARSANQFRNTFGIHLDLSSANNYKRFQESSTGNRFFNSGEEFGQQGLIDPRFIIHRIYSLPSNSDITNPISITFKRPNFDAEFRIASGVVSNADSIAIDITPRGGATSPKRTVLVSKTGQISVE